MGINYISWCYRRLSRFRVFCYIGVFGIVCVLVFYGEENWRGHRALTKYVRDETAQGLHVEWEACIPPPVPDTDNFAMTPSLAALYDFKPGTQEYQNSNAPERIDRLAAGLIGLKIDFLDGDWLQGEHVSLTRCLTNKLIKPKTNPNTSITKEIAKRYGLSINNFQTTATNSEEVIDPKILALIQEYAQMTTQKQAQEILQCLESLQPAWDDLHAAMKRPHCRYPAKYENKFISSIKTPHIITIRQLCTILRLTAVCHLELDQGDAALADLELGFYLSNSLKTDPWMTSYYSRLSIDYLLTQAIWEGTSKHLWSATQLERLQKMRQPGNEVAEVRGALLCERAMNDRIIEDTIKLFKFDWKEICGSGPFWINLTYNCYFQFAPKGWFDWEKIHVYQRYDEFTPQVFKLPESRVATNVCSDMNAFWEVPAFEHLFIQHCYFARLLSPHFERMAQRVARVQSAVDLTYLGCAIERYRMDVARFPVRLNDLVPRYIEQIPVDIWNEEPYRYRLNDKNRYVLYSIGVDGKDDGGTAQYDPEHRNSFVNGDWIWRGGDVAVSQKP